jgi:hypothetical protein
MLRLSMSILVVAALTGCGSFLPTTTARAPSMPYFTAATASLAPPVTRIVGPVEGHSCRNVMWDPPASEADALAQMQGNAAAMGATGIVDVSYSRAGTDLGTNCWQSVSASGTAVVFKAPQ